MTFTYKKKRCFIKPIGKLFVGLSSWAPGVPYVQKFTVDGPGYVAHCAGVGSAFARKAKDARQSLQEMIDKQPQVIVVKAKATFVINGAYLKHPVETIYKKS